MHYKKNRHAKYRLTYHLVVVTKYRHPVLIEPIKKRLEEIANHLFSRWGCEVLELNSGKDHLHILFDAPPQINLAKSINNLKTVSSRYIRKEFAVFLAPYY
ncbi:IS200/IS605 family transposase [Oceanobacillus jeddahense]|uniref:IS200/IS605 family transposase n=1 Tax=Oceanobacillus jeddahense TaxID=1462527 RepID=A0ABY5JNA5_9BACI|nr:IS200/IS605 family transposase [Oceanobacillus jeddahense]UUI01773.1 IS200/IS605 family transposase [Oceanobacillus jeddahense]